MYPWPVAHTYWQGQRFKIYEAGLAEGSGPAGQVLVKTKKELIVGTGQGALSLKTVQPAGKPKMGIVDFLNGAGRELEVGDFFGQ
jgi:methionyl-tRNA formyltransferase